MSYKKIYPNILIISNNPLSKVSNNGKTLASFFQDYPEGNIAQLYFSNNLPDVSDYKNYYRISDYDILKSFSFIKKEKKCGGTVLPISEFKINKKENSLSINKYEILRIIRELFWKSGNWNTSEFNNWLESFNPEIIFFCAGDSGFAFDIVNYIKKKYKSKLAVYITDDYILDYSNFSYIKKIRRKYILRQMKKTIEKCNLFITISNEMRNEYKKIFKRDSILAVNMTEKLKLKNNIIKDNDTINLIYAGGLHYKRYVVIGKIANAIQKYNYLNVNKKKVLLKIYSNQIPTSKMLKYLNIDGASKFCGSLCKEELVKELNRADIPVHVEAFDSKSIISTRLSISTKIPEYLSLGKPILAVGPKDISSMIYLSDCAYCINNIENIYEKLIFLMENNQLQKDISIKAMDKYYKNHRKEVVCKNLIENILKIY